MMSRAHIYCHRPERHFSKRAEFISVRDYRQRSTEESRRRNEVKMISQRAVSLQNINTNCDEPPKRSDQPIRIISRHTNSGSTADVRRKIMTLDNSAHLMIRERKSADALLSDRSNSSTLSPEVFPPSGTPSIDDLSGVDYFSADENDNEEHQLREKKVTFVLEMPKKQSLTAQVRRQNFLKTYSKGDRSKFNHSSAASSSTENAESTPSKIPKSVAFEQCAHDAETLTDAGVSPRSVKQITSTAIGVDRFKQQTTKRKLKSCRSRSFHKSLDSSIVHQKKIAIFSYKKPLKAVHPEVVTMISLEQSGENEEKDLESVKNTSQSGLSPSVDLKNDDKLDSCLGDNRLVLTNSKTDSSHQSLTGIMKFSGLDFKRTENDLTSSQDQRRNLFAPSKNLKITLIDEISRVSSTVDQHSSQRIDKERTSSVENKNLESKMSTESQLLLRQTMKEKECWSSFNKMTKKGFLISFDTILRGLLTPTEYRLRKDDMSFLTQD